LLGNSDIAAMSSPNLGGNPQVNTTVDNITLPTGEQGTVRAYLANSPGGGGRWGDFSGTNNTKYSGSVWVRTVSGTGSAQIDVNDGGIKTISLTEEWQRVSTTHSTNNTYRFFDIYFASPVTIYYWGVQIEEGAFTTSYIPTYGSSSATRGADLVEITEEEFSEFYNQTEGSFVSEIMLPPSWPMSGYASCMMTLSDGSYNNRVTLSSSTGSAQFNADVNIGSGTPTRANLGNYTSGSYSIKAAMAYKESDSAGSLNGAAAVTSSPGTLPLLTRADIGKDHANYNLLNGHMKRLMYYSKRLSNNQLRTLTS